MAVRAAVLEQENIRLRLELEHLRAETDRLRVLVLSPTILPASSSIISTSTPVIHHPQTLSVISPLHSRSPRNEQFLLQLSTIASSSDSAQ